jgi:hypothetical protein
MTGNGSPGSHSRVISQRADIAGSLTCFHASGPAVASRATTSASIAERPAGSRASRHHRPGSMRSTSSINAGKYRRIGWKP